LVAGSRSKEPPVVVDALAVVGRRRVDLAPEAADDVRPSRIAVLEGNQHLVLSFRTQEQAATLAAHRRRQSRPVAQLVVQVRELHADPAQLLLVVQVVDNADDDAVLALHVHTSSRRHSNCVV
jgi:hypothetical protein